MNASEYEDFVKEVFLNQTEYSNVALKFSLGSKEDEDLLSEIVRHLDSIKEDYVLYIEYSSNTKNLGLRDFSKFSKDDLTIGQIFISMYIDWILHDGVSIELITKIKSDNNQKLYDLLSLKDITDEDELDSEITLWRMKY